jgi:hypothetical protein
MIRMSVGLGSRHNQDKKKRDVYRTEQCYAKNSEQNEWKNILAELFVLIAIYYKMDIC